MNNHTRFSEKTVRWKSSTSIRFGRVLLLLLSGVLLLLLSLLLLLLLVFVLCLVGEGLLVPGLLAVVPVRLCPLGVAGFAAFLLLLLLLLVVGLSFEVLSLLLSLDVVTLEVQVIAAATPSEVSPTGCQGFFSSSSTRNGLLVLKGLVVFGFQNNWTLSLKSTFSLV